MARSVDCLMYAVQVMNFLKTLAPPRTLKDREESVVEAGPAPELRLPQVALLILPPGEIKVENESHGLPSKHRERSSGQEGTHSLIGLSEISNLPDSTKDELGSGNINLASGRNQPKIRRTKSVHSSSFSLRGSKKMIEWPIVHAAGNLEKGKGCGSSIG
ncbi:hypothetical protein HAX54_001120 [Datura stramonium]|uniref:Uncharacterized protein n=1 Tax=Datura stramonium TaxID=4076 RepID=A0ABS8RSD0_DATST|nr:hypothetical protein [Datura stramonium]